MIDGSGELDAQAILVGNWADQHSGNRAPMAQYDPAARRARYVATGT